MAAAGADNLGRRVEEGDEAGLVGRLRLAGGAWTRRRQGLAPNARARAGQSAQGAKQVPSRVHGEAPARLDDGAVVAERG